MIRPFLTRGVRRQIKVWGGQKLPLIAGHKLLYRCNLECEMCPFWRRPDEELLSTSDEVRLIHHLASAGIMYLGFEGGEPLLRRDLPEILREAHGLFHTSLVTNGWLLEHRVPEFGRYLDYLFVSIDGIGALHDRLRGIPGSYERALKGIARAKEYVPIALSFTLTRDNLGDAEKVITLAEQIGVAVNVQIAYNYSTAGSLSPLGPSLRLTLERLLEMKHEGAPILNTDGYFTSIIRSWFDHGEPWECRPWMTMNVDPTGRIVLPCYVLKEYGGDHKATEVDIPGLWASIDWEKFAHCNQCGLSCYLEPSLFNWTDPYQLKARFVDQVIKWMNHSRPIAIT